LDFQHRFALSERQEVTWGLGYRYNNNLFDSQRAVRRIPKRRQTGIYSSFVQDKITLAQEKLCLTVGSKFERNSYTGFEYQPSARILWTQNEKNTIWGAITRAVRTPSRRENDLQTDSGIFMGALPLPNRVILSGNKDFEAEEVMSYELGYRVRPADNFFLDFTGFYNVFDNLLTHETPNPTFQGSPIPHLLIEGTLGNKMYGELYGVELAANWNVTDSWKLAGGYTFLQMQLHLDSSSASFIPMDEVLEDYSPHNQFHLRSYLDLPGNLEFDTAIYYVDSLYGMNVPAYIRCDARLGWHISKNMELSAVVQNLWDSWHSEFNKDIVDDREIGRSFFVRLTYRY
jgi:iron complex outermembrane receptor protein